VTDAISVMLSEEVFEAMMGVGLTDLVQQGEDLDLGLQFFRNRFDHQVGGAGSLFDGTGKLEASKGGVGIGFLDFAELYRLVEIGANLGLGLAQAGGQDVFEDGAIAAEGGHVGDSPAHDARANHRDRSDLGHYLPSFSNWSRTLM
jgi:hypothetical protein